MFWTLSICSSTSFVLILPLNIADAVKYRPWRGSAAHIMFLESHICWVSSGTVRARYCWEPRDVRGAKPTMKKWRRGKGMRFTASFLRSEFNWPGNRKQQVTPDIVAEIRWFKSPTAHNQKHKYKIPKQNKTEQNSTKSNGDD